MSDALEDFKVGTTVKFTATLTLNDEAADITSDEVQLVLQPKHGGAATTYDADVSGGSEGAAQFELTPEETELLSVGVYQWELVWTRADGSEYVPDNGRVNVLPRLS